MKLLVVAALFSVSFNLFATNSEIFRGDSGIDKIAYDLLQEEMENIVNDYPEYAELVNIGESIEGRPTYAVLIRDKSVSTSNFVFMSGATHGNEYLNIEHHLIAAFLDRANEEFFEFYENGGAIFALPVLNRDGYKRWIRYNANAADLNRDFGNKLIDIFNFRERETINVVNWVRDFIDETGAQFRLSMDYHCCLSGTLLYPWAHTAESMPEQDLKAHNEIGEMMKEHFPRFRYGPVADYIWYVPVYGTSQDYWYSEYNALAFSFEGNYGGEEDDLYGHIAWWKDIISSF